MAKKPALGSGQRFENLTNKLSQKKGVTDPAALAAFIGRKKYGSAHFEQLSQKGKSAAESKQHGD